MWLRLCHQMTIEWLTLWNQVTSVMLADGYTWYQTRLVCKRCDKFQTKFISKFCRVEKGTKYSYNYKKIQGDRFKDFPYGAPVVNDEKQVVGIVKSYQENGIYFEVVDIKKLKFH